MVKLTESEYRDKFIDELMDDYKGDSMVIDESTELKMKQFGRMVLDNILDDVIRDMVSDGNMDDYMPEYYPEIPKMLGLME